MTSVESPGLINLFSEHRVAGNLLMILLILFGIYGLANLSRQVLPDFTLDIINITVVWPGASPADVEANILEAIEPEVRFLDGVDSVASGAVEGSAGFTLTFKEGTNMSKALTDVQAAVSQITTFPADIERPVITQLIQGDDVCRIEVSGPLSMTAACRVGLKPVATSFLIRSRISSRSLANAAKFAGYV